MHGIRTRTSLLLLTLGLVCAHKSGAQDSAPPIQPSDFAYGYALTPTDESGVYRTTLPSDVYRVALRTDLSDLRVFGGQNDVVPHALRPIPPRTSRKETESALPFFPLHGEDAKPTAPLSVRVETEGARANLSVQGAKPDGTAPKAATAYLIDASKLGTPPSTLTLAWNDQPTGVWARVLVEASPDLNTWHSAGSAVIASLDHAGEHLERRSIPLDLRVSDQYLRLSAEKGSLPTQLTATSVSFTASESETEEASLSLQPKPLDAHVLLFDAGGPFPIHRLDLRLGEENTLIKAVVFSSEAPTGPFVERHAGTFYRLDGKTPLRSAPAELGQSVRARYWKLAIDGRGGGVGRVLPTLEATYRPDEILWLARGKGPFTLAFGSARAEPASLAEEDVAGGALPSHIGIAGLGARRTLSGTAALRPPKPKATLPWSTYALWAVLILAALSVVALSVRLATRTPR